MFGRRGTRVYLMGLGFASLCIPFSPAWPSPGAGPDLFTPAETRAVIALQRLASAQARFQGAGRLDADGDGLGEYGFLPDLEAAGACLAWVADGQFYRFRVYLPDERGRGVAAPPACPVASSRSWCAYAWPIGREGGRIFFVDHSGTVRATSRAGIDPEKGSSWAAACPPTMDRMCARPWPTWGEWTFLY